MRRERQDSVDLTSDVAPQAANDLGLGLTLSQAPRHVGQAAVAWLSSWDDWGRSVPKKYAASAWLMPRNRSAWARHASGPRSAWMTSTRQGAVPRKTRRLSAVWHALDPNTPLSALVLPAIAHLVGIPTGEGAEWRRTVWAEAGVLCGELTNPVLTLNLPGDALTPTGRALQNWSGVGQPVHLTARQLLRHSPRMNGLNGRLVHLCENPTVVAEAANRLGQQCAPLVCTSTHPAAAATILLRVLAEAGAVLLYHGDFDWAGITIANGIIARFGARPWRLDTSAYRRAADSGGQRLRGRPVLATWDRDLGTAMQELGVRVEEERVMAELLNDLIE